MAEEPQFPAFRQVPMTGVIFVSSEAMKEGFYTGDPLWANLGQGAPEVNGFGSVPPEPSALSDKKEFREYGSVLGTTPLREAVANLYNELYRKDQASKYTAENVAIAAGGRLSLSRIAAALGNVRVGHLIPDYTAYEELLTTFRSFTPVPVLLKEEEGYAIPPDRLREQIRGLGLAAFLASNPSNPTGRVLSAETLKGWVEVAEEEKCAFILDEFYSRYWYSGGPDRILSAAAHIKDVNRDPVLIVDGLTKNLRRPGWRVSWTLGPKEIIKTLGSVGSFLDGGAPHPLQAAALPLLEPEYFLKETSLLRETFKEKRDYALRRLTAMGLEVPVPPDGAFYAWVKATGLPKPLNDGMQFFREGLKEKVIVVPGEFFDVNPGKHRKSAAYKAYVRVSFGPPMEELTRGLDALERVVKKFS